LPAIAIDLGAQVANSGFRRDAPIVGPRWAAKRPASIKKRAFFNATILLD
jgi:hypothetical protein